MIKRELYMKRIRPFIGSDLVKVMTGIRQLWKIRYARTNKRRIKSIRC